MGQTGVAGGSGDFTKIARQVVSGTVTAITFSNIPQTYENLVLELYGAGSDAAGSAAVDLTFNGDTGAHYDFERLFANSSGVSSAGTATQANIGGVNLPGSTAPANSGGYLMYRIPGYARTVFNKVVFGLNAFYNGTTATGFWCIPFTGQWRSNAAITSITLTDDSAVTFVTGTVATLYGEG